MSALLITIRRYAGLAPRIEALWGCVPRGVDSGTARRADWHGAAAIESDPLRRVASRTRAEGARSFCTANGRRSRLPARLATGFGVRETNMEGEFLTLDYAARASASTAD